MEENIPDLFDGVEDGTGDFRREVVAGLSREPKSWPCKFLYDYEGSLLFNRICELDEYYVTRTEISIMREHADEIGSLCGSGCMVVEMGSGSGIKTRLLLDALADPSAYVPIDISRRQLMESAATLRRLYPALHVTPLCADYNQPLRLPSPAKPPRRRIVFFPGSTIGNFEPGDAAAFLRRMLLISGTGGGVLIGADMRKPRAVLEHAYNDRQGVTAAFNLNVLRRINRELGADFRLGQFAHRAVYNEERGRIEMRLISLCSQVVNIGRAAFPLRRGEIITTEHSYKYTPELFSGLARRAGLTVRRMWSDQRGWFGVYFLAPV
jgi:dimethylhistidine N-methyltransferase